MLVEFVIPLYYTSSMGLSYRPIFDDVWPNDRLVWRSALASVGSMITLFLANHILVVPHYAKFLDKPS